MGSKDLDSNCFLYLFSTSDLSDKRLKEGVGRKEDEKKKKRTQDIGEAVYNLDNNNKHASHNHRHDQLKTYNKRVCSRSSKPIPTPKCI